jgi:hypothetical protein
MKSVANPPWMVSLPFPATMVSFPEPPAKKSPIASVSSATEPPLKPTMVMANGVALAVSLPLVPMKVAILISF